jgi:hypothetical protein
MIHSIFYPKGGSPRSNLSLAQITQALHEPDGLLWVSLEPLSDEEGPDHRLHHLSAPCLHRWGLRHELLSICPSCTGAMVTSWHGPSF